MVERVSIGGNNDFSVINQLFNSLISIGWIDRGTQTKSINIGGTNYNITARGCANANGWVVWGITSGWNLGKPPLYFSHINNQNNFMNDGADDDKINIRAVGCLIPNVNSSTSAETTVRLYANNTSFVLVSIQGNEYFVSGNYNEYYYGYSRLLMFLNWIQGDKEYVVMSNDIFVNLSPFQGITNIITAVKQGNNVKYYYNESRTKDRASRRDTLPETLFNTGMYITIGFRGTENSIDISPIKVKIGDDIVDLPDEVVFVATYDNIISGTRLTTPPYDLYRSIGGTRYYLGVKYV